MGAPRVGRERRVYLPGPGRAEWRSVRVPASALLLALFAPAVLAGEEPGPPALTAETFAGLRDRILPTAAEEEWRRIPWKASLLDAAREARRLDRPILLWAMNGHPLGCT